MVGLCKAENRQQCELRDYFLGEDLGCIDLRNVLFSDLLLIRVIVGYY